MNRTARLQLRLHWLAARVLYGLTNFRHPARASAIAAVQRAGRRTRITTTPLECVALYDAAAAAEKIPGDIAEAGVYLGGTALVMLQASSKRIHLFDTFEGLPHGEGDSFSPGDFAGSVQAVQRTLTGYEDRVTFHAGLFPGSAAELGHLRFAFVHLDLDLYDSTKAALEWFWPRTTTGGIVMSHDHPYSPGVVRAFAEFFAERPEAYVQLSGMQCLAVKASS